MRSITARTRFALVVLASVIVAAGAITTGTALGEEEEKKPVREKGKDSRKKDTGKKEKEKSSKKKDATAREKYAIVTIGETTRVVKASELAGIRQEIVKRYRADLKAWQDAGKEARKAKQKFTQPKPARTLFKVVATNFSTEDAAKKRMEQIAAKEKDAESKSKPKSKRDRKGKPAPEKEDEGEDDGRQA